MWKACGDDEYGQIVRLLILTAQRRTEIGGLMPGEVDFERREINLPSTRTKNRLPHTVPLSGEALAILEAVKPVEGRNGIFGRNGFKHWSQSKADMGKRLPDLAAWTLHDIRRSVVTHLCERGFAQPHVCEAIINHISGHKAGVAGVYNRAAYAAEKRRALDLWAQHLGSLIEGCTSNVIALKKQ